MFAGRGVLVCLSISVEFSQIHTKKAGKTTKTTENKMVILNYPCKSTVIKGGQSIVLQGFCIGFLA